MKNNIDIIVVLLIICLFINLIRKFIIQPTEKYKKFHKLVFLFLSDPLKWNPFSAFPYSFIQFLFSTTLVFGICSYFLHQNSTQDKSIAQLSVCTRLCTIACLLCKLPAFPSFGIRLGDTNLTCTQKIQTQ